MGFLGRSEPSTVEESLRRIATALELLVGLGRPQAPEKGDPCGVTYFDDEKDVVREVKREAYRLRTGIDLPPDEDPPEVPGKAQDGL